MNAQKHPFHIYPLQKIKRAPWRKIKATECVNSSNKDTKWKHRYHDRTYIMTAVIINALNMREEYRVKIVRLEVTTAVTDLGRDAI